MGAFDEKKKSKISCKCTFKDSKGRGRANTLFKMGQLTCSMGRECKESYTQTSKTTAPSKSFLHLKTNISKSFYAVLILYIFPLKDKNKPCEAVLMCFILGPVSMAANHFM